MEEIEIKELVEKFNSIIKELSGLVAVEDKNLVLDVVTSKNIRILKAMLSAYELHQKDVIRCHEKDDKERMISLIGADEYTLSILYLGWLRERENEAA